MRSALTIERPIGKIVDGEFQVTGNTWIGFEAVHPDLLPAILVEAAALLPAWKAVIERAALETWLTQLAVLCAGRMTLDEARGRALAYVSMPGFSRLPTRLLTVELMERASQEFDWFPGYGKLLAFIEAELGKFEVLHDRLRKLAALGVVPRDKPATTA